MQESNLALYMASELAALLLLVTIFLLVHVSKLKKLIAKLEEKIQSLRQAMGVAKQGAADLAKKLAEAKKIKPMAYMDYLDAQIEDTREHHSGLNPDRDIVLDISTDAPLERQAAALRHAFLIAEKEADYSGEGQGSDWDVLQSKFQQIIQFYEQAAEPEQPPQPEADDQEEVMALKKRIENLERFKKLFFDMESKWSSAKKEAKGYQEQLLTMGSELGASAEFEGLINKYANSYGQIDTLIEQGSGKTVVEVDARTTGDNRTIIANQEEMIRLRNMAVDQHKVITELQRQLADASTAEEQQAVMAGLVDQLERQDRFIKEAETCAQLLEDELNRALEENQMLREKSESAGSNENQEQLESLVADLTDSSREMLKTIAALEDENTLLQHKIVDAAAGAAASAGGAEVEALNMKLQETQQELLNLQTQHIELEERYLELKMESM
ncbi:hypothetical protein NO559_16065 [Dasania sp. GY-MA-18]|uniref:Uncharacterized protein n=1 Tax=Dasania phycosphaerae TaxID=2950436 RepID=A0A9J6RR58_9GAMM|nr:MULTISPECIES: hypothetical protein [Dasania]MCR8924295.1 hypothetical protein [Dasania sp. GY-MA-18]MCZ0866948.1 hypothetical protein [Dasania phycosphaerae]MCZ0870452.1 hypothetical protein [Dasania phycosphaerae]